jgi:hypothetical protein
MGKLGQFRRLGDMKRRISDAKKKIKEAGSVTSWFSHLPVAMSKDSFVAVVQKEITKNKRYREADTDRRAKYLTIAFDTVDSCPETRISPIHAIALAKEIERKLGEYDSETSN